MSTKKVSLIKHLYLTIVTVVVLAMMIVSAGYLVYAGLYSYVFSSDTLSKGYPPSLFVMDPDSKILQDGCTDTCVLSDTQKEEVRTWMASYQDWKDQTIKRIDSDSLATALSFFIVSLPLFIGHFVLLRIEHRKIETAQGETTMFYIYYYIVALGTLIAAVVYASLLVNTTLRTWVITDADNGKNSGIVREVPAVATSDPSLVAITSCATPCGFSEDEKALIEDYKTDLKDANEFYSYQPSWQKRFSTQIGALLVTIPFFVYHWVIIRRKSKQNGTPNTNS